MAAKGNLIFQIGGEMARTYYCNSSRELFSALLKIVVLVICFTQPCHTAPLQGATSTSDSLRSDDTKTVSALPLNLPTLDLRQAADRYESGATAAVATQSGLPFKEIHRPGLNWSGVLAQSALFLGIQQGWRIGFQSTTREALKGKFFDDWYDSVASTHGWGDGDDFLTNYIGHPMAGGVVGNIYVQNDSRGHLTTFGKNPAYWNSRLKGMLYTAVYSTAFELGPISEASIGNVGHMGNSQSGAVDLVVTPLAGFGWQVGEDILDRYLIVKIENRIRNPVVLMFARSVLNPTRAFANMMRFRVPWNRDTRPGVFGRSSQYYDPQPEDRSKSSPSDRTK
jgi:hypothetical protein